VASHDVDMRSDIWSLGVVIHEMITGRVPFDGETIPAVCAKILRDAPEPMSRRRPGVPPGLDRIVLRCLEKERKARFQNVAELVNALVEYGPKRARASAERITRIIAAAGLARQPEAPPVPYPADRPRPPETEETVLAVSGATEVQEGKLALATRGGSRSKVFVGAALALALGGTIIALGRRHQDATVTPATASAPASAAMAAGPAPPPTVAPAPPVAGMPAPAAPADPAPAPPAETVPASSSHHRKSPASWHAKATRKTIAVSQPPPGSAAKSPASPKPRLQDLMDDRK
jgi:Protein tyrosine and serine/threonine kinase